MDIRGDDYQGDMLDAVLSTENLIEKMLSKFGSPESEDLSEWNR
jgi:hypothetical protein